MSLLLLLLLLLSLSLSLHSGQSCGKTVLQKLESRELVYYILWTRNRYYAPPR